jgi:hypothetical protein
MNAGASEIRDLGWVIRWSILPVAVAAVLAACSTHRVEGAESDAVLGRRADSIAALDPRREVDAALARGDKRFIGVCNYACAAPGAPNRLSLDLKIVEGTSDVVFGPGNGRLNRAAHDYGTAYNRMLLEALRLRGDSIQAPLPGSGLLRAP